jgi:hypothetical protein
MKKWIIIMATAYVAVGIFMLSSEKESQPTVTEAQVAPGKLYDKYHMYWIVNDPENSNYKPPYWLENNELLSYVKDKSHEMEKVNPTDADDRLMAFFAELQLGESRHISSFVNPMISYKDLMGAVEIDKINLKLEQYAKQITKNRTIQAVYLSKPTSTTEERVIFDVTISFQDESIIILKEIPMVKMTEDHNWFIDLTLTEIASLIEPVPKREGS